jgi:hypothetical protein
MHRLRSLAALRQFLTSFQPMPAGARLFVGICLLFATSLAIKAAPPIAVFGRESFFSLDSSDTSKLKNSGFNTAVLFVVDVETNGDLNFNGDHLVVTNGVYMGDPAWGTRLAALKQPPTSITRLEVCTGGAGAQSWANIKNLVATNGTGTSSILYRNFLALKNAINMDAICNDDEVAFDAGSAATFNQMITSLGLKNTLCPYDNNSYWESVFANSAIDAVYLQCYDGGAGNDPGTWNGYFNGFEVAPGDWSNDGLAAVATKFSTWSPIINGGFIWQFENISASDLASYGAIIKQAVDPLVVSPSTGFSGIAAYNQYSFAASTPFILTNRGTSSFSWGIINTSSWLTVSSSLGMLAINSTTTNTITLNTALATSLPQGVYTANVIFTNKTTGIAVARTFTLNTAVANWPLAYTGNTAALLASNNATGSAPGATALDLPNNYCFYQQGLSGSTRGLPLSGVFSSLVDSSTAFQIGPFGATDALMLGDTYPKSGTLTLSTPQALNSIAVLACSANGNSGGQGTFFLTFTNGARSPLFAFNEQDWFYVVTNVAIQGFGRLKLGSSFGAEDNGASNPNLYQTTVNLAALGLSTPVASITFSNRVGAGSTETTAILSLSGMPATVPLLPPTGFAAIPGTNATVFLGWSPVTGATNYNLRESSTSGGTYNLIGRTNGTSFTATGLANGSTYYFAISSQGTVNESTNSLPVSALPGSYVGWLFSLNPVAYWPLSETAGSTAYELVQGSNGVYAGGYTLLTGGATGAGFSNPHRLVLFNGSSGYAQVPRFIGSTNFSIAFWLRTGATGGTPNWYNGEGLVDGDVSGTTGDFGVALVGTKVGFGIGNPDTTMTSVKVVSDSLWHLVVATHDAGSGTMSLYIDGKFDSTTNGPAGPRTNSPALCFGRIQSGGNFLGGSMSDVAFYQQALSTNQIATLYSSATGIFYNITLTNRLSGSSLVLTWPGNGKLLEATNMFGPWTTNTSVSPATITPNQPQKFYKVQTQ